MSGFITRTIDELGRVVLAREQREALGLRPGDTVEMGVEAGGIVVRAVQQRCTLCGAAKNLQPVDGHHLCADCIKAVKAL